MWVHLFNLKSHPEFCFFSKHIKAYALPMSHLGSVGDIFLAISKTVFQSEEYLSSKISEVDICRYQVLFTQTKKRLSFLNQHMFFDDLVDNSILAGILLI